MQMIKRLICRICGTTIKLSNSTHMLHDQFLHIKKEPINLFNSLGGPVECKTIIAKYIDGEWRQIGCDHGEWEQESNFGGSGGIGSLNIKEGYINEVD